VRTEKESVWLASRAASHSLRSSWSWRSRRCAQCRTSCRSVSRRVLDWRNTPFRESAQMEIHAVVLSWDIRTTAIRALQVYCMTIDCPVPTAHPHRTPRDQAQSHLRIPMPLQSVVVVRCEHPSATTMRGCERGRRRTEGGDRGLEVGSRRTPAKYEILHDVQLVLSPDERAAKLVRRRLHRHTSSAWLWNRRRRGRRRTPQIPSLMASSLLFLRAVLTASAFTPLVTSWTSLVPGNPAAVRTAARTLLSEMRALSDQAALSEGDRSSVCRSEGG
jgi:hypothetical protein